MKEVEKQRITKVITQDFGISMHLKGSHYIEEAVALALQDSSIFVMEMYQTISEKTQQKCRQHRTHHTLCH